MDRLLALAAGIEAMTGVALIVDPSLVARLLLGAGLSGVSVAVGRVAGFALLALGLACWPGKETTRPAPWAIVTYNLLVTPYLLYLGIRGEWVGRVLWPAVALHAVMTFLLVRTWWKGGQTAVRRGGDP